MEFFTSDETEILKDAGIHVTVPIQSVSAEEKINIYRNIAKTTDELYLSYAISIRAEKNWNRL